jgi:hypothetical protein
VADHRNLRRPVPEAEAKRALRFCTGVAVLAGI